MLWGGGGGCLRGKWIFRLLVLGLGLGLGGLRRGLGCWREEVGLVEDPTVVVVGLGGGGGCGGGGEEDEDEEEGGHCGLKGWRRFSVCVIVTLFFSLSEVGTIFFDL